jgi:hypothetical protein
MHALQTVHTLPDLRIAAGRLLAQNFDHFGDVFRTAKCLSLRQEKLTPQLQNLRA